MPGHSITDRHHRPSTAILLSGRRSENREEPFRDFENSSALPFDSAFWTAAPRGGPGEREATGPHERPMNMDTVEKPKRQPSPALLAANRRNARKSTGPGSIEGKAGSAQRAEARPHGARDRPSDRGRRRLSRAPGTMARRLPTEHSRRSGRRRAGRPCELEARPPRPRRDRPNGRARQERRRGRPARGARSGRGARPSAGVRTGGSIRH